MVDRRYVEQKCDQLVTARFWPREQDLRFRAWLSNFTTTEDRTAAATILDRFVFINEEHAGLAVSYGYSQLLGYLHDQRSTKPRSSSRVRTLHEEIHFAPVRGESPNPAESGNAYMRIARETLEVSEDRIHDLDEAIAICAAGHPLVLLDDFSGTANQVVNTLTTIGSTKQTLLKLLADSDVTVCCITAVMTSCAIRRLRNLAPRLLLFPGYIAPPDEYSLDALLPIEQFPEIHRLLADTAPRFSLARVDPIRGLNSLGLMLGIHDRIPDASLPILWADGGEGWNPLKRRKA